jgi:signal transduction histidine kinase
MFSRLLNKNTETFSQDELKTLAHDLDFSVSNLFKLLENLLEWSRSQIGRLDFTPKPFDIASVLTVNQLLLHGQAEDKKIKIIYENPSPMMVHAHHNSIDTVVRNLISNAIKFTPEGGTITLQLEPSGRDARVSIIDTGVGIKESAINELFKVGTHHSSVGTAKEKGTGLGLMLCKDFIENNKGTIGVESKVGKGSTFYFTVPLAS